jgi:hypothetical protein
MTLNLARIRKAITAGVGTATTVYGALAAFGTVAAWWLPFLVAGVAGLGVGGATYFVPNAPAPVTSTT